MLCSYALTGVFYKTMIFAGLTSFSAGSLGKGVKRVMHPLIDKATIFLALIFISLSAVGCENKSVDVGVLIDSYMTAFEAKDVNAALELVYWGDSGVRNISLAECGRRVDPNVSSESGVDITSDNHIDEICAENQAGGSSSGLFEGGELVEEVRKILERHFHPEVTDGVEEFKRVFKLQGITIEPLVPDTIVEVKKDGKTYRPPLPPIGRMVVRLQVCAYLPDDSLAGAVVDERDAVHDAVGGSRAVAAEDADVAHLSLLGDTVR